MNGLTVTASDASTVVITSDTPNPAVPIEMTISNAGILDSKVVQQHGGTQDATDQANDYLNASSAGSGPYMVASADRTSQIVLKLNPNYWGSRPAYSTVVLRNVTAATQALDIQDGQAQLAIDVSPQDAASMGSSVNVIAAASADVWLIGMNASPAVSSLTANQDFRDAVRYGLDYKGLVALAGKGAIQGTGFVPVGILGALPAAAADQRDLARAKASLAKVGVANPTVDLGYYTDRVLDGLPIAPVAAKIQSDLKEVGITVNLVGQPIAVLLPKLKAGKFPMWIRGASSDFPDPSDFLNRIPGPGGVLAKWQNWVSGTNPSVDALVATATTATATGQRDSIYKSLVKATNDTAYTLYPVQLGRNLVCAKSVNATLNPFDYVDLGLVT